MKGSKVTIKVKAATGDGFMPDAGEMAALKFTDINGVITYKISDKTPIFGGNILSAAVVNEV
jgi:hypothetical protein